MDNGRQKISAAGNLYNDKFRAFLSSSSRSKQEGQNNLWLWVFPGTDDTLPLKRRRKCQLFTMSWLSNKNQLPGQVNSRIAFTNLYNG